MREFDYCLQIKREIYDIDEEIYELRLKISAPKNQVITGMPRGGNNENAMDRYVMELERLEKKKANLIKQQQKYFNSALQRIPDATEQEICLLRNRFIQNLPWKKCVSAMNEKKVYGKWNINRVFYTYRKINKKCMKI